MSIFKRRGRTDVNTATIPAIIALITHPNTGRNERAAALAAYERVTGQSYNIVNARRYQAQASDITPEPQRRDRRTKRAQPTAADSKQEASSYATSNGYTADATCTASRACGITGQDNVYGNSFGGSYKPGGAYSTIDALHAEYDAACVGDY